ncbi:xylulokinase [Pontibacillus salipaludis]|uniref:Gluconate kinase n=1 Tax=Pontibacillus salipaludis TaxID=1697394 RepID=A0ABQ1Q5K0_9BACI|nr:FGGY family carbohydrate kinase [Pontibacillus salipaludis]GGD12995.1 gluconate kinase [Pontibacillus salipaludis]
MEYVASFDIGTTGIKGCLVSRDGEMSHMAYEPIHTYEGESGEVEQSPDDWWKGVKGIFQQWKEQNASLTKGIRAIAFSGQMEDVIPITAEGSPVRRAILYSDGRAVKQAEAIREQFGTWSDRIVNAVTGTTPLAKIAWMMEKEEDLYNLTSTFLFSSKDYIIYKLTGKFVADPTTSATTGMMNIHTRDWEEEWVRFNGISLSKMPSLLAPEEGVGMVLDGVAVSLGLEGDVEVFCGVGDAGATTIGAGNVREGSMYAYLGTTGWVATTSTDLALEAPFTLAHLPMERLINIAPVLNAGNVHRWAVETYMGDVSDEGFKVFDAMVDGAEAGSKGVLFLPYLHGERSPVQDPDAKGSYIGITGSVERQHMARAVMEGISFSIRQLFEDVSRALPSKVEWMTLIGGGSKSKAWCQMIADVLQIRVHVPSLGEYLPSFGAASTAFVGLGWCEDYEAFVDHYLDHYVEVFHPNKSVQGVYDQQYGQFKKIYEQVRMIDS